ncbi:MAG: hypothetical protein H6735_06745 [Alphaproteobacteria bacterium]|nr:hypothetical protein [Alphaproteobacteria bacterium]
MIAVLTLFACSGSSTPPPEPEPAPVPEPVEAQPGTIPGLDFPVVKTTAAEGDFVLAPSRDFFDRAVSDGIDKATFIFYGATMLEPGPAESKVKSLAGTEFTIPNSLIIPIPRAQEAKVGDLLLGHWESGSGLQRAIVVSGTATEPVVRDLDLDLDNPAGVGQKDDAWKADRFRALEAGRVGVSVACKSGDKVEHGVLVALTPKKLLSLGFAGRLSAWTVDQCMPIDPGVTYAVGDTVQVPWVGTYTEAKVTKVDAKIGRVFASVHDKETGYAVTDVAKALDTFGEGFVAGKGGGGEGKAGKGKAGEGKAPAGGDGGGEGKGGKGSKAKRPH